jgi:hypothetical protein
MPQWRSFITAQELVLKEPLRCLEHLPGFAAALSTFQRSFSGWYYQTHSREKRIVRYGTAAGIVLKIAGKVYGAAAAGIGTMAKIISSVAPEIAPANAKGFIARLVVAGVDAMTGIPDPALSYSLDLIRSNAELTKEDIGYLLSAFKEAEQLMANSGDSRGTGLAES